MPWERLFALQALATYLNGRAATYEVAGQPDGTASHHERPEGHVMVNLQRAARVEFRRLPAQAQQAAIPVQHAAVALVRELGPVQPGAFERAAILRVRHVLRQPAEGFELVHPAAAGLRRDLGIAVVGEEDEGSASCPLLAHEEQG